MKVHTSELAFFFHLPQSFVDSDFQLLTGVQRIACNANSLDVTPNQFIRIQIGAS